MRRCAVGPPAGGRGSEPALRPGAHAV